MDVFLMLLFSDVWMSLFCEGFYPVNVFTFEICRNFGGLLQMACIFPALMKCGFLSASQMCPSFVFIDTFADLADCEAVFAVYETVGPYIYDAVHLLPFEVFSQTAFFTQILGHRSP